MEEENVNAVNSEIIMSLESKRSKVPFSPGNRNSVQHVLLPLGNIYIFSDQNSKFRRLGFTHKIHSGVYSIIISFKE